MSRKVTIAICSTVAVDIARRSPSLHDDERRALAALIDNAIGAVVDEAAEIVRRDGRPGTAGEIEKLHTIRHKV